MDTSIVFHKTGAGQRELEKPQGGLDTTARQLLIFIDGKRSVGDLMLLLSGHGEIDRVLLSLLGSGLITTTAPATSAAMPAGQRQVTNPGFANQGGLQQAPRPAQAFPQAQSGQYPAPAAPVPTQSPTMPPPTPAAPAPTYTPAAAPIPPGVETWPGVMPPAPAQPAAAPPATPAQAPPRAPDSAQAAERLDEAKGAIMREIREIFGKDADPVVLKVRNCRTLAELGILVSRVRGIAVDYAGRQQADEFLHTSKRILELAQ